MIRLLLGLEVVEEDGALLGLLTPILDDDAGAVDDLASVALTVEDAYDMLLAQCRHLSSPPPPPRECRLTETGPLAELLAIRDLDQRDLVLVAQSNDELLVGLLFAGLVEDAHVSLATVEGLGRLTQATGKAVVHEGELQDTLESVQNGHLALGGGIGRDFDLFGDFGGVLFYVRLGRKSFVC